MAGILVEKLRRLRFLSRSSETLLNELTSCGNLRRYMASESIYIQNGEPKAAHLILSGTVNRETIQGGDSVIQLSRAFAGDWLGLANIMSQIVPYMHSAIAADTSAILSFDLQGFALLRSKAEFSHYLLEVIGKEQLAEEERYLNNISSSRSYDKLILFLAAEMERMRKQSVSIIHAPYIFGTQEYFAKAIGMRRETVSRDLQPLINAGIIERTHGVRPARYTILRQDALSILASSPLRRNALYENTRSSKSHRRFSDVA